MAFISNDSQLTKIMMNLVLEAFKAASESIQDDLKINAWNEIYSRPKSRYYRRTAQLMKSIITPKVKISGNQMEVEIGVNPDSVRQIYRQGTSEFNAHMNQDGTLAFKRDAYSWGGTPVNEAIFMWYDEGTQNAWLPEVPRTNFWYDVMGSRLSDRNPDYDKAYKKFEEELLRNLQILGGVANIP